MSTKKQNEDKAKDISSDEASTEAKSPPTASEETFLDRLKVERDQVGERLEKLSFFIDGSGRFSSLDLEERDRLRAQRTAMSHYHGILIARIAYHTTREAQS